MGKIETWEVTGRNDESITFLFKRRNYKEEKLGEQKPKKDEDGFDEETRAVLTKLEDLNMRIRKKYYFDSMDPKNISVEKGEQEEEKPRSQVKSKEKKKKANSKKSDKLSSIKGYSSGSVTEDDDLGNHVMISGVLVKKGALNEPCDHRGVPLSHPMAMTPYPGATTAAEREKARKMLKAIAKQMYDDEKKGKEKKKDGRKSSNTKSTKSSKRSKTSTKSMNSKSLEKSKSRTSKSSNKKMGCDKCGSCQKCIYRCSQKHPAEQKVTQEERDNFLKGIKCLRQKIVKPEKSRERAIKSPYDVTQSVSDSDLSNSKSIKGSKSNKKSLEK